MALSSTVRHEASSDLRRFADTAQKSSEYFAIAASTWLDLIERVTAAVAFTISVLYRSNTRLAR